jgi:hypothetical protein
VCALAGEQIERECAKGCGQELPARGAYEPCSAHPLIPLGPPSTSRQAVAAQHESVQLSGVATAVFRLAVNAHELLARIDAELGIRLRVLSQVCLPHPPSHPHTPTHTTSKERRDTMRGERGGFSGEWSDNPSDEPSFS